MILWLASKILSFDWSIKCFKVFVALSGPRSSAYFPHEIFARSPLVLDETFYVARASAGVGELFLGLLFFSLLFFPIFDVSRIYLLSLFDLHDRKNGSIDVD